MSTWIIGEAPGPDELREGKPFIGSSGNELTRMLNEAGINRNRCFMSNVADHLEKDYFLGHAHDHARSCHRRRSGRDFQWRGGSGIEPDFVYQADGKNRRRNVKQYCVNCAQHQALYSSFSRVSRFARRPAGLLRYSPSV